MHYQPSSSRHETSVQQLRLERKSENQRLEKLRNKLQSQMQAKPIERRNQPSTYRAA